MANQYDWRRLARDLPTEELIDELNSRFIGLKSLLAKLHRREDGGMALNEDFLEMSEFNTTSDAPAPADNRARIYVRDNGAGKEQLVVRFNTGAVQVLATEP